MNRLKIGITCIGYECLEHVDRTLEPWLKIRNNEIKSDLIESVEIGISHGCFEETAQLGYPIKSQDGTLEKFSAMRSSGQIDHLFIHDNPKKEYDMWTENFVAMQERIDMLVLLPIDEVWTVQEIENTLRFIQFNELADYFKINFKNYCIDFNTWVDDFIVPRFWFTKRQGGLKGFYKDDLVEYNNGKKDVQCSHLVVPTNLAFPKHYSWVGSKEYLQRKLKFQGLRYGDCSYAWDEATDRLKLNDEFYRKFGRPKPILKHD
jgi:hypothetical protein